MNTIIGKNNVNEQTTANAATATPAPVAEQKEQQTAQTSRRRRSTTPPDVAGNDAGAARFRCPTEKG